MFAVLQTRSTKDRYYFISMYKCSVSTTNHVAMIVSRLPRPWTNSKRSDVNTAAKNRSIRSSVEVLNVDESTRILVLDQHIILRKQSDLMQVSFQLC